MDFQYFDFSSISNSNYNATDSGTHVSVIFNPKVGMIHHDTTISSKLAAATHFLFKSQAGSSS